MEAKSAMLVALLLGAGGLAGCIENPLTALATDDEVSAFENRKLADAAAAEWNEGAMLIGVMAFELTESEEAMILPDPDVGNGLAPAWWYVYSVKGEDMGEVHAFKVTAVGDVTSEDDAAAMATGFDHGMAGSLGEWTIDSTDAIAAAKTDEAFRVAAEGFNASVVEGVASHEGKTAWWLAAMSADGFVVASVDAITGEVLEVEAMDMDFVVPTFAWGAQDPAAWTAEPIHLEGEGAATPSDPPVEIPFSADDAMHGTLMLDLSTDMPGDGLHWTILDADGEVVHEGHISSWFSEGGYEEEIELEDAGDYVLSFRYMSFVPELPASGPVGSGVSYTYVLDLMPGEMEHEDEDDG